MLEVNRITRGNVRGMKKGTFRGKTIVSGKCSYCLEQQPIKVLSTIQKSYDNILICNVSKVRHEISVL